MTPITKAFPVIMVAFIAAQVWAAGQVTLPTGDAAATVGEMLAELDEEPTQ